MTLKWSSTPGDMILSPTADPLYNTNSFPSLDLQFATTKTLNDEVSGQNLVSFTRASTGTYVDSSGVIQTAAIDAPRFDHDPVTGASLGLLVEESRTNIIEYSNPDVQSYWGDPTWVTEDGTVTDDAETAPDGTTTARQYTFGGTTTSFQIRKSLNVTGNYVISVFAKKVSSGDTLTVNNVSTGDTAIDQGSEQYANGWTRYWFSVTNITQLRISFNTDVYVWGAQVEAGSFPTSYIPTSGSTVTRAADLAEITGTNFSSWYNQSEGTVFADAICNNLGGGGSISFVGFLYASSNQYIDVLRYQPTARAVVTDTGLQSILNTAIYSGSSHKSAHAFKSNDFALSVDGEPVLTDTLGSLPSASALKLGNDYTNGRSINGHISRFTYYPYRLPDAKLQTITS